MAGISSSAAVWVTIELAKRSENQGKTIVDLLPDTGDRYLSTLLFLRTRIINFLKLYFCCISNWRIYEYPDILIPSQGDN